MSGKTREYLFSPSESAGDIAQFVFDNWPAEWEEEAVSFINWYQALARFLFCNGLYGLRYLNQVSHRKTCSQESCRVFLFKTWCFDTTPEMKTIFIGKLHLIQIPLVVTVKPPPDGGLDQNRFTL